VIYFDNAATTWPRPPAVTAAMVDFMEEVGANPGRAAHRRAVESGRIVYDAREAVAELFNTLNPLRTVFGANVTEVLNLALRGTLRRGDHVVTSSMEHNSVMRPPRELQRQGVALTVVQCSPEGFLDPCELEAAIRPNTVMIFLNHASNPVGTLLPVTGVGGIARERDLLLLIDATQIGGAYPVDVQGDRIDLLGSSGHQSLCGPMGTGGLIIGERVDVKRLRPLKRGGMDSSSELEEQTGYLPDMCESGTLNAVGLAGLAEGVRWVLDQGVESIRDREVTMTQRPIDGLRDVDGVAVYDGLDADLLAAIVSFGVSGTAPSEVGLRLDEECGIMCRGGLHCAPAAPKTIGTFPEGTVRFGLSVLNTLEEVEKALQGVRQLAEGAMTEEQYAVVLLCSRGYAL
jgi:cysteine desulfurase family protein